MFCRKCGKEVMDDGAFCINCGEKIAEINTFIQPNNKKDNSSSLIILALLPIVLMVAVAVISILAAIALPAYGNQIKKSKDSKAIEVLGAIRANLAMAVADLDGDVPNEDTAKYLWLGGTVIGKNDPTKTAKITPLNQEFLKIISDYGVVDNVCIGTIKCGTAKNISGSIEHSISMKYVVMLNSVGKYEAKVEFDEDFTDTKGRAWNSY